MVGGFSISNDFKAVIRFSKTHAPMASTPCYCICDYHSPPRSRPFQVLLLTFRRCLQLNTFRSQVRVEILEFFDL